MFHIKTQIIHDYKICKESLELEMSYHLQKQHVTLSSILEQTPPAKSNTNTIFVFHVAALMAPRVRDP